MFGGVYYIWIMAAFFVGCGGVLLLLTGIFLIGHWMEKKKTGAKHGFLELPHELRPKDSEGGEAQHKNPPDAGPPTP